MQELGSDYYKLHKKYDYDSEGGNEYEAKRRIEWEEEEEKSKTEYFKKIAEEVKRGYYRKTVAELIEERSWQKIKKEKDQKQRSKMKRRRKMKMMKKLTTPRMVKSTG